MVARKVEIILCVPVLFSVIAFLYSFRKPGRAGFFAILSALSLAAMIFYASVQYEEVFGLMSDFTSLRIGAFLYMIGIFMTIIGQLGRKKN